MTAYTQAERDELTQLKIDRDEWRESTIMANENARREEAKRRAIQEELDILKAAPSTNEMEKLLEGAVNSRDFYKRRVEALQTCQSTMRDPERTMVCDIIANGSLLFDGLGTLVAGRYALPQAAPSTSQPPIKFRHGCEWCGRAKCRDSCPGLQTAPSAGNEIDTLKGLLREVSASFTRDDDLPNDLLPRIDAATKGDASMSRLLFAAAPSTSQQELIDWQRMHIDVLIARNTALVQELRMAVPSTSPTEIPEWTPLSDLALAFTHFSAECKRSWYTPELLVVYECRGIQGLAFGTARVSGFKDERPDANCYYFAHWASMVGLASGIGNGQPSDACVTHFMKVADVKLPPPSIKGGA